MLSLADGAHDLALRDALFNVTDALETATATGANDVTDYEPGQRALGATPLVRYIDPDGAAQRVAEPQA